MKQPSKWISVKKHGLPTKKGRYLVTDARHRTASVLYFDPAKYPAGHYNWEYNVTHYMDVPELPRRRLI